MLGFASAAILTRRAFQIPLTFGRLPVVVLATIAMAGVVKGLDALLDGTDALVLAVVIPAGIVVYSAICLIGNVAHSRDHFQRGFVVLRSIWAS
jgi:hypothetical protein